MADPRATHPTRALIHLEHLAHNVRLLQELVGARLLWPAVKADAYGHGARIVAGELVRLGYGTLCVAHPSEALPLLEEGVRATFVVLSAALPEQSACFAEHADALEPVVCTEETVDALSHAAVRAGREIALHVKVETGMGRIGIHPEALPGFLARCRERPGLRVRGLMSHFACADEADKRPAKAQIEAFARACAAARPFGPLVRHFANSAAVFDLPESHLDAARPGVSVYGLRPSGEIANPRVEELRPVLEWRTRITFLKEVEAGTGLSYGHTFRAPRPSLIATLPVGYGDGLRRNLSNQMEVLVGGARCPQVGRITMDQTLVDVTALRGRVALGDEVALLGRQGREEIEADEWAARLGTINYEITTAISQRVPRVAVRAAAEPGPVD